MSFALIIFKTQALYFLIAFAVSGVLAIAFKVIYQWMTPYKETDLIKGIQLGTVDFTITGESLQNWAPSAALLAVPCAVRDLAHLDKVVSGSAGEKIARDIEAKTQLKPLCYFARGPRNLTSNREIRRPDELNGLKVRVPNVPLFVKFWEALGAKPTPMAFSEVFTSLQNHTIDAQENPLALIKSASFRRCSAT